MVTTVWGHLASTNTTVDVVAHKLWGHLQICDAIVYDKLSLMLLLTGCEAMHLKRD